LKKSGIVYIEKKIVVIKKASTLRNYLFSSDKNEKLSNSVVYYKKSLRFPKHHQKYKFLDIKTLVGDVVVWRWQN
jgi:hypothetical protein